MRNVSVLVALLGCGVGACTPMRMAPPADLVGKAEVLLVSDRSRATGLFVDEGFKLGRYRIADVDRDWNRSIGFSVGPWGKERQTTGYAYALVAGSEKLNGKCGSTTDVQSVMTPGGEIQWGHVRIGCACEGAGAHVELVLSEKDSSVHLGEKVLRVTPVHDVQNGQPSPDPTGFRFDGESAAGAVEVLYPGQVWLAEALSEPERQQLACLSAGLMLFQPPDKH